jgi:DNA-binding transcriptional ArsR family regulator
VNEQGISDFLSDVGEAEIKDIAKALDKSRQGISVVAKRMRESGQINMRLDGTKILYTNKESIVLAPLSDVHSTIPPTPLAPLSGDTFVPTGCKGARGATHLVSIYKGEMSPCPECGSNNLTYTDAAVDKVSCLDCGHTFDVVEKE